IQEHAPLDPRDATGVTLLAFGGVYVLLLAGIPPGRPRVCWLLPLVWLYLSVDRVRHAPLFAVVGLVAIADFFPHTRWARRLAASGGDLYVPAAGKEAGGEARPLWPLLAAASAVFALCIGLQAARAPVPVLGHGSARLDPARWPVELLQELRRFEHSRAGGTPVFNEFLYGAFLIYHTPGYRVFVDDRCEVFGGPWLAEFVRAEGEDTAGYIERWERAYGRFDLALTETGSGFDDYFANSPGWAPVRRTPTASLYRREGASPTPP
ncbi:MAG TPA: hypothetical protein VIL46_15350, partial [Gemmataceae bacterium]